MAWYDRLRGEGAGRFDAMRQALPLFSRAPHARPGDRAAHRRAVEPDAASRDRDGVHSEQLTEYQPLFDNAKKLRALLSELQDLPLDIIGAGSSQLP
jgi:hypothetical protein